MKKCRQNGVAIRIGTNHGSLSERMMMRYGDTPLGMVESALEFIGFAEQQSFYNIIVSMKASNPKVMIQAYRLLASRFLEKNMDYPLHLGVTEAGDGPDGRIRSAAGIGALLADGLGDTIRVSLTEDPVAEIPVAKKLVEPYNHPYAVKTPSEGYSEFRNPFEYRKLYSSQIPLQHVAVGEDNPVRVEVDFSVASAKDWISQIEKLVSQTKKSEAKPEIFHTSTDSLAFMNELSDILKTGKSHPLSVTLELAGQLYRELELLQLPGKIVVNPLALDYKTILPMLADKTDMLELKISPADFSKIEDLLYFLRETKPGNICFSLDNCSVHDYRKLVFHLQYDEYPIVIAGNFSAEDLLLQGAVCSGALLLDGIGDVIRLEARESAENLNALSYDILQVCGLRSVKTEFISCPSCGRTLFDIQKTLGRIREKTGHLKGVKIAVMGCIVNGPGEMADADYGYVGAGEGKVHLYRKQDIVEKNIPDEIAGDKLIELIKTDGKWTE